MIDEEAVGKQSVKVNFAMSMAYQILVVLLPFITVPYISRVLGPEGVGIYSYSSSLMGFFTLFAVLGTADYGSREIARSRDNFNERSQNFWEIESLSVITSCICLAVWLLFVYFQANHHMIYLILSLTLISTMMDISWFFVGLELFRYIITRNIIVRVVGIILIFALVKDNSDLILYIIILSVTNLLGTLSMWLYLPRLVKQPSFHNLHITKHIKQTLVYFIPAIAISLYTILNNVMIGSLGTDYRENGYYTQGSRIVDIAKIFTFVALNKVLGVRMSYLYVKGKNSEIKIRLNKSLDYVVFVGMGFTAAIIAIAPRFVPFFFGEGYEKTIVILQIMAPLILIIGISNCLGSQYFTPAGFRARTTRFLVYGAIVNIIIGFFLIKDLMSIGAAISSLIAETVITFMYIRFGRNIIPYRYYWALTKKKLLAGLLMGILIYIICRLKITAIVAISLASLVGLITYLAALYVMHDSVIMNIKHLRYEKHS